MMRTTRSYYEILGLPRNATVGQVKRRYRQLVRKYHPDVAPNKDTAHRLFIQITQAYEALIDPVRRRAYDATLDASARTAAGRPSYGTPTARPQPPAASVAKLIKDAQWSFLQKRFHDAASQCKEALKIDGRNAQAHSILGDIYRAQKRFDAAIRAYSYAVQFNPYDRETQRKLTNLIGRQLKREQKQVYQPAAPEKRAALNMVWWAIVFFLVLLIGVYPGRPIPWLGYYIPQIRLWSWNLIGLLAAASAMVGALLSLNGLVSNPDEELVFESGSGNWIVVPTGLILLIGSGFFFLGAAAFYIVVGLAQGSLSRSVLTVFACVVGLVFLASLTYLPDARDQVLLFGGNVSFLSMLGGWYTGSATKPLGDA